MPKTFKEPQMQAAGVISGRLEKTTTTKGTLFWIEEIDGKKKIHRVPAEIDKHLSWWLRKHCGGEAWEDKWLCYPRTKDGQIEGVQVRSMAKGVQDELGEPGKTWRITGTLSLMSKAKMATVLISPRSATPFKVNLDCSDLAEKKIKGKAGLLCSFDAVLSGKVLKATSLRWWRTATSPPD